MIYMIPKDELIHYGVKGMKWGHRKLQKYEKKARIARASAKEWDEMAKAAKAKGNNKKAAKYAGYAKKDRADAARIETAIRAKPKRSAESKTSTKSTRSKKVEKGKSETDRMLAGLEQHEKAQKIHFLTSATTAALRAAGKDRASNILGDIGHMQVVRTSAMAGYNFWR